MNYKKCTKCEKEFPETEDYFYKQKKYKKDGTVYYDFTSACKQCNKQRSYQYMVDHREQHSNSCRVYRDKHAEEINARHREWFYNNREHAKNYLLNWQNNHRDRTVQYGYFKRFHKTHNITNQEWELCKAYFNYECAYCGLPIQEHKVYRNGKLINMDLHKEHVDNNGTNGLDNCVPSCRSCNSSKHDLVFNEWYKTRCSGYSEERYEKIVKWLNEDYKNYIEK